MKTEGQIAQDLVDLVGAHYYSEDFELLALVRAYRDGLDEVERERLCGVVLRRMLDEGSLVDILLCSLVHAPSAGSLLAARLDRETEPSQLTRALISALQHYEGDDVFRALARFVDSDQEREATQALARVDFPRAAPYVIRALRQDQHLDLCLHILRDRSLAKGLAALAADLAALAALDPAALPARLALALRSKRDRYNPFAEEEIVFLLAALR